ncbi:MAG: hypothetical protein Kow0069_03610 [Promethearchaeota archaeon]
MQRVIAGVVLVVRDGPKILVIRRNRPPYAGLLTLPGGKVEFGEHPTEAAARELLEETGLRGEVARVPLVLSELVKGERGDVRHHFLLFVCEVAHRPGPLVQSGEGEAAWVDEAELLAAGDVVPSDKDLLGRLRVERAGVPLYASELVELDAGGYAKRTFGPIGPGGAAWGTAGNRTTVEGTAARSKAGPVLVLPGGEPVFLVGGFDWRDDELGEPARLSGVLAEAKVVPDPVVGEDGGVSQGARGAQLVLRDAERVDGGD